MYGKVMEHKIKNENLKVLLSVGGAFNILCTNKVLKHINAFRLGCWWKDIQRFGT